MRKLFPAIVLLLLSFWVIKPLFHDGFFSVHDNVQVERVFEMGQALKDGQFPVRWVKDLGYGFGYPIFNFYAPLPYYFGGFLTVIGFDALISTKIMFIFGILLAVVSMYLWAKEHWGMWGGFLAAILYIYSPYHALDIYVRGAVDEFWAMGFLPLVFWGLYKTYKELNLKWVLVGTLGLSCVILSHNLTALMLFPFLVLYILFLFLISDKKVKFLLLTSYFLLLGTAISAFYWLPALAEMRYTNVFSQITGGSDFHNHFIYLNQLWDFPWGYGGSAGPDSGISFKIGKPNIVLWFISVIVFLILSLRGGKSDFPSKFKGIFFLGIIGFLVSVMLTNKISQPLWEFIKPLAFIQYPWRFNIFAVLFSSILSGFSAIILKDFFSKLKLIIPAIIIILVIFFHAKYFQPQFFNNYQSQYYTNSTHLKYTASKISDEYLPRNFPEMIATFTNSNLRIISKPDITIKQVTHKSQEEVFETKANTYAKINIMTANFPGWKVFVDKQEQPLANSPFLTFTISSGTHLIKSILTNTPVRSLANIISLLGVLVFSVILLKLNYGKSH